MGLHVTTSGDVYKYVATTSLDGVKLQLFLTDRYKKKLISGDIGSAYLHNYTK